MFKFLSISGFLTLMSVVGFAGGVEPVQVYGNCDRFEIRVPANPTTGFQWTLAQYDKVHYNFITDDYMNADISRMGSPGEHAFYFERRDGVSCPSQTTICLNLARAWEQNSGECTKITIRFK